MSDLARAWLANRAGPVPPALAAAMERAADESLEEAEPALALEDAARAALQRALADCDSRTAALPLLAADALITAACEAAAETGAPLDALARRFAPERLAADSPSPMP